LGLIEEDGREQKPEGVVRQALLHQAKALMG
jgi:hypothetical protein